MRFRALLISLFALVVSQQSFAGGNMPPEPAACPGASQLMSGGFLMTQQDERTHGYVAFNLGSYGTSDQWGFILGLIDAKNEFEALMEANKILKSLSGTPHPMYIDQAKTWACLYHVNGGSKMGPYQAIAMSPLPTGMKLSSFLK
jgi:hypothetical protein